MAEEDPLAGLQDLFESTRPRFMRPRKPSLLAFLFRPISLTSLLLRGLGLVALVGAVLSLLSLNLAFACVAALVGGGLLAIDKSLYGRPNR